jgi:hypothetical protein
MILITEIGRVSVISDHPLVLVHRRGKPERIERAIADDLAFLAAHPVRRSNSETMARRREFKRAMRQRIKDIAASRDLSAEDIKAVMTLKHHEIAPFTEEHEVNVEWLLTGEGRIFKNEAGLADGGAA